MTKYIIEGVDLNFNEELKKLLETEDEDDTLMCKISGQPLNQYSVTLSCNHHFNYDALYKEIYNQKYINKTYDGKVSHGFIQCPYCRKIDNQLLPYYEELEFDKIYGINTMDLHYVNAHCSIFKYGVKFKQISGCKHMHSSSLTYCQGGYVACIPGTDDFYCVKHYIKYLKLNKINKEKQVKQQKLDELNILRASVGKKPLKRLPKISSNTLSMCVAILKSGKNAGNQCGCKVKLNNNYCNRHLQLQNKN